MSGHSKWSTIKRQKGLTDAKRGNIFTKLSNAISVAVREGRGVEQAVEKAKASNMPKDNIQRAIDKGMGKGGADSLETVVFEGFGPGGVAVIVEAITDNNNRTSSEIRNIFSKHGGTLGGPGSVAYMFTRVGEIEGETLEKAVEVGALDFEDGTIYTKPEDLHRISEVLGKSGDLIYRPNKETMVQVVDKEKLEIFLEAVDELEDVQNVYINA